MNNIKPLNNNIVVSKIEEEKKSSIIVIQSEPSTTKAKVIAVPKSEEDVRVGDVVIIQSDTLLELPDNIYIVKKQNIHAII